MSKAGEGLTGLLGAYGSDNEDESGSGSHEGDTLFSAPPRVKEKSIHQVCRAYHGKEFL